MGNIASGQKERSLASLPIDTPFHLPSPLPSWPPGGGFGKGCMDLGGLEVVQVSTFKKIWSTQEGGQNNLGATFFSPSPMPNGFSMLGCYSQPNADPLFGCVLVGKDVSTTGKTLAEPTDYTLVWSSENVGIKKQDGVGYFWLPVAPDGYRAVGVLVTASPDKPSLREIMCVRTDLTDECEKERVIWERNGFEVHGLRPTRRGINEPGVSVGTFQCTTTLSCLKNSNFTTFSSMPNLPQLRAIAAHYAPLIYFHPNETFLSSSTTWFFSNGALLYSTSDSSHSVPIAPPEGANLPQGGSNDGAFWLDLPADDKGKKLVQKGDVGSSKVYVHGKPLHGGVFTDLGVWVFYPFNGPASAKVALVNVGLGKIGEHVGDWEHLTLRVSNFTGELKRVYFSQHSGGQWVDAPNLEFKESSNRPVAYSSLRGHAFYPHPGLVLQGNTKLGIGIRNDTAKGKLSLDTENAIEIIAAEYLGGVVEEPPWVNYTRLWGPKITYNAAKELNKVIRWFPGKVKRALQKAVDSLPAEVLGQVGPTGPKEKSSWIGDEK